MPISAPYRLTECRRFFAAPVLREVPLVLLGRESARKGARGREQPVIDALAALALARGLKIDVATVPESALEPALEKARVLVLASPGELTDATRDAIARLAARRRRRKGAVDADSGDGVTNRVPRSCKDRAARAHQCRRRRC